LLFVENHLARGWTMGDRMLVLLLANTKPNVSVMRDGRPSIIGAGL